MISNSKVSFCVDTLLVETVLSDPKFYKKAGFVQDLLSKVKDYFGSHLDQSSPTSSVINMLAPGALWMMFSALGIGKWGFLLGLLMNVFHIDVAGMLQSLWTKVKDMVSGGQKVSSAQIDAAAESTAKEFAQPGSKEEAEQGYKKLQEQPQAVSQADDQKVYSSLELMHDAKIISLALIEYENESMRLTKEAAPSFMDFLSGYSGTKAKGTNLLSTIFGWVIKIALASAGLMVLGDVVNEIFGRPSALSKTYQAGKDDYNPLGPSASETAAPAVRSTQTKFTLKSDGPIPVTLPIANNPGNIENMLIQYTKDTYSGLEGKESYIRSSPAFQDVKDDIEWFNVHNPGTSVIFMPRKYPTRKQLVDNFIDDVAKSAP